MRQHAPFHISYWLIAVIAFLLLQSLLDNQQPVARIAYSEFVSQLKEGRISELAISERQIEGRLKEPLSGGQLRFTTLRVEPQLAALLEQ